MDGVVYREGDLKVGPPLFKVFSINKEADKKIDIINNNNLRAFISICYYDNAS